MTKVALQSGNTDVSALQRHRTTVIDCLRDPDISIRKRALDLAFHLITPQNIRILTRELLTYLEICENESKQQIGSQICEYAGNYRPNKRWEIDTIIRVLKVAGKYIDQIVVNHFVKLVTTGDSKVHQYSVQKLYGLVKNCDEFCLLQVGLLQVAIWCVGEYGDLLTVGASNGFATDEDEDKADPVVVPTEQEVVSNVISIMKESVGSQVVREYGITALAKLSTRFKNEHVINSLKSYVGTFKNAMNVEIQQRAVEYDQIFLMDDQKRYALLERMPVLETAVAAEELKGKGAPIGI
jgi:AP-1 complex subunit gamma-1